MNAQKLTYAAILCLTGVLAGIAPNLQAAEQSAAPVAVHSNATPGRLSLYSGQVQVLDVENVTRIAVGSGAVLKASVVAANQVVLIGQAEGTTSLRVWTRGGEQLTYEIKVTGSDTLQILRDAQDLLADDPSVTARQVDGHVLIEGDVSNSKSASRIQALQQIYPQIVSIVPVKEAVAAPVMDRMVYMEVKVVEILKSSMRRLGVNWDAQTSGGLFAQVSGTAASNVAKAASGSAFGITANIGSRLDLLEQAGESWTLAEPTVSCKSGGEAKFTVGGEIPIPVASGLGTTSVVYKEYGIIMEFKPIADGQGNISSSIVAEVSEPDSSFANSNNTGLVAFLKTRTQTEVSLKENQTLVISGLLKNTGNQATNGIPGAKDLPVLGRLFKSNQFKNDRTELVVMVTPRSMVVSDESSAAAVKRAEELQSKVQPKIDYINGRLVE